MFRLALHWQIFIALIFAVLTGVAANPETTVFGVSLVSVLAFFGTLFLNALKMLIVPLIMSSIIVGMMEIQPETLGRLGYKTLLYYATTSLIAILLGLMVVNMRLLISASTRVAALKKVVLPVLDLPHMPICIKNHPYRICIVDYKADVSLRKTE